MPIVGLSLVVVIARSTGSATLSKSKLEASAPEVCTSIRYQRLANFFGQTLNLVADYSGQARALDDVPGVGEGFLLTQGRSAAIADNRGVSDQQEIH